jgi:hypothetical protein
MKEMEMESQGAAPGAPIDSGERDLAGDLTPDGN